MRIQNTPFGRNPFKRGVAILTAALFLLTQLSSNVPGAFAKSANNIQVPGGNPSGLFRLASDREIRIPPELGLIDESFHGASGKTVLYIQDAHDSLEAQENIAKIIDQLVANYGVKTVFEEGYEGPVPTDKYFGVIKDPKVKEKVSYFLMDHLRLGGAEYAHINRTKDFSLIGADSLKLHKENINQYRLSAAKKDTITKDLKALEKELKSLVDTRFPKALKEWLKIKEQFDAKNLDFVTYLGRTMLLLGEHGAEKNLGLIRFLIEAMKTNDSVVIEKAKHIDAREVFGELVRLEETIRETCLKDATDKKLFDYYKTLNLLKRLNDLQVSQEEYEAVKVSLKAFDTESFAKFIFSQAPKTLILSRMWERNIKDAVRFYEIAATRDGAISKAFGKYFSENRGEKVTQDISVLVYGGFHKENIKRILEKNNISYLVVSPRIIQPSLRHEEYYKRLMTEGRLSYELPANLRIATRAESRIEIWNANPALARAELRGMEEVAWKMPNAAPATFGLAVEQALKTLAVAHQVSRSEARTTQPSGKEGLWSLLFRKKTAPAQGSVETSTGLDEKTAIPLDLYIPYRKLFRASGTSQTDIMRMLQDPPKMRHTIENAFGALEPARLKDLITRQASVEQSILELVSNASDAITGRTAPIGRFGMGALQMLAFVIDEENPALAQGAHVIVETATKNGKGRRLTFFKGKDGRIYFTPPEAIDKKEKGTAVRLLFPQGISSVIKELIQQHLRKRLSLFTKMRVFMNGELLNTLEGYNYLNGGQVGYELDRARIDVHVSDHEIIVEDAGSGMSDEVLLNKYLIPRLGENEAEPKLNEEEINRQVHIFYKSPVQTSEVSKSRIVFQVAGVTIQETEVEGYDLPGEMVIQLPSSTRLTVSRDGIEIDGSTHLAIKALAKKIVDPARNTADRIALINGLMQAVRYLDDRNGRVDIYQSLVETAKEVFIPFFMRNERLMLPNKPEYHALEFPEGTVFVDEDLIYKITPELIPSSERLTAFEPGTFRKAFIVPFKEGAKTAYLPLGPYLLINRRIYEKYKAMPMLLNLRLNFYVGYGRRQPSKGRILTEKEYESRNDLKAAVVLEKYPTLKDVLSPEQTTWLAEYAAKNVADSKQTEKLLTQLEKFLDLIPETLRAQIPWRDILPFSANRLAFFKKLLHSGMVFIQPDPTFFSIHGNYFLNREHPERVRRYLTNLLLPDGARQYTAHPVFHHVLAQVDVQALNFLDQEVLDSVASVFEGANLEGYEEAFQAINKGLPHVKGDGVKRLILRWLRIYKNDPKAAVTFMQRLGRQYRRELPKVEENVANHGKEDRLVHAEFIPRQPTTQYRLPERSGFLAVHLPLSRNGNPVFAIVGSKVHFFEEDRQTGKSEPIGEYSPEIAPEIRTGVCGLEWTGLRDEDGQHIFLLIDRYSTVLFSFDIASGETRTISVEQRQPRESFRAADELQKTSLGTSEDPVYIFTGLFDEDMGIITVNGNSRKAENYANPLQGINSENEYHVNHGVRDTGMLHWGKPVYAIHRARKGDVFVSYDSQRHRFKQISESEEEYVPAGYFTEKGKTYAIRRGETIEIDLQDKNGKRKPLFAGDFEPGIDHDDRTRILKVEGLRDADGAPVFAAMDVMGRVLLFSVNPEAKKVLKLGTWRLFTELTLPRSVAYDSQTKQLVFSSGQGRFAFDLARATGSQTNALVAVRPHKIIAPEKIPEKPGDAFQAKDTGYQNIPVPLGLKKTDGRSVFAVLTATNGSVLFFAHDSKTGQTAPIGSYALQTTYVPNSIAWTGLLDDHGRHIFLTTDRYHSTAFSFDIETGEKEVIDQVDHDHMRLDVNYMQPTSWGEPGKPVFFLSTGMGFGFLVFNADTKKIEIFPGDIRMDDWIQGFQETGIVKNGKPVFVINSEYEAIFFTYDPVAHRVEKIVPDAKDTVTPRSGPMFYFEQEGKPFFLRGMRDGKTGIFSYDSGSNVMKLLFSVPFAFSEWEKNILVISGLQNKDGLSVWAGASREGRTILFCIDVRNKRINEIKSYLKLVDAHRGVGGMFYQSDKNQLEIVAGDTLAWLDLSDAVDIKVLSKEASSAGEDHWMQPEVRTGFAALDQRDDLSGLPPLLRGIVRFLKDENVDFVEEGKPDARHGDWESTASLPNPVPVAMLNYIFDRFSQEIKTKPKMTFEDFLDMFRRTDGVNIKDYVDIIRSAIQGQDKTRRAWVRELIQNSRDAMRREREQGRLGKTEGTIEVRNFINNGDWVYSIRDTAGMNLWHLLRYYFPLDQTSKDHLKDTGNLGQGNYTLFADFDKVFIRTSDGEGLIHEIVIERSKEQGPVIGRWDVLRGNYKGTEIRRIKSVKNSDPQLESLFIQEALENFAGAVQSPESRELLGEKPLLRDFEITYNDQSFSESIEMTSGSNLGNGFGVVAVGRGQDAARRRVIQDELFIKLPDADELRFVPPRILLAFERFGGLHISIGKEILLNIPRNGYAQKHKFLQSLRVAVLHNVMRTILKDYMERNAIIYAMSPDYFTNEIVVDNPEAQKLVGLMVQGKYDEITVEMLESFVRDPIKFFELISYVPFTSSAHNGEINLHRLRELRMEENKIRRARAEREYFDALRTLGKNSLGQIFEGKKLGEEFSYDFGGRAAIEGKAGEADEGHGRKSAPQGLSAEQEAYVVELTSRILGPIVGNEMPYIGFFSDNSTTLARAGRRLGGSVLEWNEAHIKWDVEQLYEASDEKAKVVQLLEQGNEYGSVPKVLETAVHESQHLPQFENPGDHTHHADETVDRGFAQRMGKALDAFLSDTKDVADVFVRRSEARNAEDASITAANFRDKARRIQYWKILRLKQDVVMVIEQKQIDVLSPEMFKELLEIAGLNNGKLHLVIPDALQGKYSQRVAELRKVASVYYGFPQLASSDKIPVIGFSDMEHDTLANFQKRLDPRLAGRVKDSAFGLNQAGSFGVGILYALKDIPPDQLRPNQNGFRYDATGRYSAQVLEVLQAYTVISTSA